MLCIRRYFKSVAVFVASTTYSAYHGVITTTTIPSMDHGNFIALSVWHGPPSVLAAHAHDHVVDCDSVLWRLVADGVLPDVTTQLTLYHIINQRHRAFTIVVVCISLVEYEIKVSIFPNDFWLSQ
jgi:hypothetical protein